MTAVTLNKGYSTINKAPDKKLSMAAPLKTGASSKAGNSSALSGANTSDKTDLGPLK